METPIGNIHHGNQSSWLSERVQPSVAPRKEAQHFPLLKFFNLSPALMVQLKGLRPQVDPTGRTEVSGKCHFKTEDQILVISSPHRN